VRRRSGGEEVRVGELVVCATRVQGWVGELITSEGGDELVD
jgi:hypothetical protein